MEIFVDSANIDEIKTWIGYGVIDGVTTNPSILLKDGVFEMENGIRAIAECIGNRPLSVEVTTDELEEMHAQAVEFTSWAENIVVKIPVINQFGQPSLGVVHRLREEGVKVNVTGILSFNQLVLAAQAGGTYLSVFAGRVSDEGNDASTVIKRSVKFTERWNLGKVLVGSIRGTADIQSAIVAGAHIITIPPEFLLKMVDHKYTRETIREFIDNAKKAVLDMSEAPESIERIETGKEMAK